MKNKKVDWVALLIKYKRFWVPIVEVLIFNGFVAYLMTLAFGGAAFVPAFVSSFVSVIIVLGYLFLKRALEKVRKKKSREEDEWEEDEW